MLEPLIISHRGASANAPENTLIAFEQAMAAGADGVEFDVQLASDGVPVVIHDPNLKRTGLRTGVITEMTSVELASVDVGTWFNLRYPSRANSEFENMSLPTLTRVLDYFKTSEAVLYIELKCTPRDSRALVQQVARLIKEYQLFSRAVVESFEHKSIREIKRINQDIRTAALFEPKLSRPLPSKQTMIDAALSCEADEIALHRSLATARTIEEARRRELHVAVWTVDHPSWIARAWKDGIKSLITNEPGRMCEHRVKLSSAQNNQA